ncbi:hypothetical protein MEQU1_000514 [Malassezia equina]|uniref:Uncharacterized protein n=1 Tax=Malassezia equina TaxID=1381935 RepID=A0AAF0ECI3_9BASI|nr:hypothetical protein MEQU1_000514 [Malassezia equina]
MAASLSPASRSPAGPSHGSPASVEALAAEMPRMPEVLVMCLVHDSPRLRESWDQLVAQVLDPLCCALAQLQSQTRLLVGGILYRSEPRVELASPLRPVESLSRVAFAPAPRFLEGVRHVLRTTPMCGLAHLDAANEPVRAPSTLECSLADPLAVALEMIEARRTPPPIAPFARGMLRTHHSPVMACHLVHVVSLDTGSSAHTGAGTLGRLPTYSSTRPPLLHTLSCLDACSTDDLLERVGERTVSLITILTSSSSDGNARQRTALAQTAHDVLRSARRADEPVPMDELLPPPWKAPDNITMMLSSAELARTLRKRPRRAVATESPSKRARGPETPPMPAHKVDPALLSKVVLLQQQQAAMLKNLSRWAVASQASGASGTLQSQMIEQFRQRLAAQQLAIKQQAERLRAGKSTDLNLLWQALVTIDKEAKEAGLQLWGPSSQSPSTSMERSRSRSSATPASSQVRATQAHAPSRTNAVWQGILKWSAGGAAPLFTLLVAMCGSSTAQALLGLPWPNVLTIHALVPVHPPHLQRLITLHRVPCVLLAVRSFPPSLAVSGAENNETNYRSLYTMLEQHHRAAYVAHGEPGCGLLIVALSSAQLHSSNPPDAPRLLAMVFRTPIPFAQLSGTDAGAASAPNTRGMISVAPAPGAISSLVPPAMPAMNGLLHAGASGLPNNDPLPAGMPVMPTAMDPVQQLLNSTSMASSWLSSSTSVPTPAASAQEAISSDLFTPDQLRALGL